MMVQNIEEPEETKEPTLEERALAAAFAIMKNIEGVTVPKAKQAVLRNRTYDRPIEHLFYDGWRGGLAWAIEMMLSGQLDIAMIERQKDRENDEKPGG